MNHTELVALWNSAHTAWAGDQPMPAELEKWRACYSGTGKFAVDDAAMPEPWVGDLTSNPVAVTLGIHPGAADAAFQHHGGSWPNTITHQHDGSYADWAATGPYFGDVWESSHGVNTHMSNRLRFLSAWTGTDLAASQVIDVPVFPWHTTNWDSSSFTLDPAVLREFVLEPIASTGATWAFGFGKDWSELIEALELPILDRLGDGGRPYPTQVDHRRWLVAEGPNGLRIAAMRMDSMPIPPKQEEVDELRTVLQAGPAGTNDKRALSTEFEADLSARLRELDMSYANIVRLLQAIDDVDLDITAWQAPASGDGVDLTARGDVAVTVRPEWADFRHGSTVRFVGVTRDRRRTPPAAAPDRRRPRHPDAEEGTQAARHVPPLLQRPQPRRHLPHGVRRLMTA